jgi:hypothetical protein
VLDLALYSLKLVRKDAELALFRGSRNGHEEGSGSSILVQVPVADPPSRCSIYSSTARWMSRDFCASLSVSPPDRSGPRWRVDKSRR